jgi:exodeoxyribonuclease-3
MAGYELAHHGEGRWNGVAIASRVGLEDVSHGFEGTGPDAEGARFIAATCGGIRVISVYAPNGRALGTETYEAKLDWYARLLAWLQVHADPGSDLVVMGDLNVAPTDLDVYDPAVYVHSTHTSEPERAAFRALEDWGLIDIYRVHHPEPGRYTWWDYRAGNFHKHLGMRIDHMLVTRSLAARTVDAQIDRSARKGTLPSDHAPLFLDVDEKGVPLREPWDPPKVPAASALRRSRRGHAARGRSGVVVLRGHADAMAIRELAAEPARQPHGHGRGRRHQQS